MPNQSNWEILADTPIEKKQEKLIPWLSLVSLNLIWSLGIIIWKSVDIDIIIYTYTYTHPHAHTNTHTHMELYFIAAKISMCHRNTSSLHTHAHPKLWNFASL